MNSTVNKQKKITQKQYRQLTLNSPLFQELKPTDYNLYDEDENATHIYKLEFRHYFIFLDIRNSTRLATNIVSYWIEPNGVISFSIHDTITNNSRNILFYESGQREIVEHIFRIKLGPNKATLASVDNDSFNSTMMSFFNPNASNPSYSEIYLDTLTNRNCEVHAKTLDAYKAGITHMKYLVDSLPEINWYKREDEVKDGVFYRFLTYGYDEDMLNLSFKARTKGNLKTFSFYLYYNEVNEEVQSHRGCKNEELFQKLKPMYRKQSLSSILKDL